jgi:hypothetical protein
MSETRKLPDILAEALDGNTGHNTETPQTLGDILGEALQLLTVEDQLTAPVVTPSETPSGPLGDVLRTATEQPSTVLVTGAKQEASSTQNSEITVSATSIDGRLAKLKRKLGGTPWVLAIKPKRAGVGRIQRQMRRFSWICQEWPVTTRNLLAWAFPRIQAGAPWVAL